MKANDILFSHTVSQKLAKLLKPKIHGECQQIDPDNVKSSIEHCSIFWLDGYILEQTQNLLASDWFNLTMKLGGLQHSLHVC